MASMPACLHACKDLHMLTTDMRADMLAWRGLHACTHAWVGVWVEPFTYEHASPFMSMHNT
jgi:hypothetical protein